MLNLNILSQFSRLAIGSATTALHSLNTRSIHSAGVLNFQVTSQLWGEPLKKKKKIDPAIIRAREERRKRKLEKQIRRLQKNARQLKPIEEIEPPLHLIDQIKKRKRSVKISPEDQERRDLLLKEWNRVKTKEYEDNVKQVKRIMSTQQEALDQLYEEDEDLYNEAVTPDLQLLPYSTMGPYHTPPIKNYDSPDGEYFDVSKKWTN